MEYKSEELSEEQLDYINNYNNTLNDNNIIRHNYFYHDNYFFILFVIGLAFLLVNTYKTIYYNRRIRLHRQNELNRLTRLNNSLIRSRMIQPYIIITKNVKINEYILNEDNNEKCSICLEDFNIGDTLNELNCNHFYHKECINNWIKSNNNCPMCRSLI